MELLRVIMVKTAYNFDKFWAK